MLPRDVSYLFEGVGGLISHQVPKQFSSNSSCSHQVPPKNSHQISLVPINYPSSKSFCSHQVPHKFPSNFSCSHQLPIIKILLFPPIKFQSNSFLFQSSSHQIPVVPINKSSVSFCSHQAPKKNLIKFLLFPSKSFCSHVYGGYRQVSRGESMKVNDETRERLKAEC
jgi:hypothetical protein